MAGNIRNSQLYSASEIPIPFGIVIGDKDGSISKWLSEYSLPTASTTTLGGIKVGNNLSITDGVLSASGGELPTASSETKGGIKIGTGLTMTGEVLSADSMVSADTFIIENTAFIRYNSTTECIEFVFN